MNILLVTTLSLLVYTDMYMSDVIDMINKRYSGEIEDPLPDGMTAEALQHVLTQKGEIVQYAHMIVADGVRECHKNGLAKEWGSSVLALLRMLLIMEYDDEPQSVRIKNWQTHFGGSF